MVVSCPLKSRRQSSDILCARGSVTALAVARCSSCVPVVTAVSAIAALSAAWRRGGSNDAPPTAGTSRAKRADTLTSSANAAIANGGVGLA